MRAFIFLLMIGIAGDAQAYFIPQSGTPSVDKVTKSSTAPGSPGVGVGILFWVAGTTAGTCKLQALAGTSTTPVTIADNVGSGC